MSSLPAILRVAPMLLALGTGRAVCWALGVTCPAQEITITRQTPEGDERVV